MGQNIGTTITAFMASLTANTQARRAALAHMFFNVFGVVAVLCVFYPACDAVRWFVTDVLHIKSNDLFLLSAFHTAFNVLNTLILIWFVKQIERFVCRVLPEKGTDENLPRLKYISAGLLSTAELSLLEARKEIALMGQRCQRAFDLVVSMHGIEKDDDFNAIFKKVEKYEGITDNMEYEIAHYLQQVADGHLSDEAKRQIQRMLREVDDLESVGDCCYNLARTLSRKRTKCKEHFTQEQMIHISEMEQLVKLSLMQMIETLEMPEGEGHDISKSYETEREINALRTSLRDNNLLQISAGVYDYDLGAFYIDLVNGMEKLGDHVLNVVQAKARQKV